MPFTIHPNFPYKTKVLNAIIKMNKDLGCLKVHYIDYEDYDKNNPRFNLFFKNMKYIIYKCNDFYRYTNGIMVVWGSNHQGTAGCWSTTGIAPGFTAGSGSIYHNYGAAPNWQLLSLDQSCGKG